MNTSQLETWAKARGMALYGTFTPQERRILQFGMHPAEKMRQAQAEMVVAFTQDEGRPPSQREVVDLSRWLAVGCMEAADAGPDKMVV